MSEELIKQLVPALITAVQGLAMTREVISKTLEQLASEIRDGKHIPHEALQRGSEDQATLDGIFGKK